MLAVLALASYAPIALVLGIGVGPLVAALMHCAVCLVRDEELRLRTAVEGVRLHWLRGLQLGALAGVVVLAGLVAVRELRLVRRAHLAARVRCCVPARVLPRAPTRALAARRGRARAFAASACWRTQRTALVRRPAASIGLALALLLINALGAVAAVLPLLTVTVAYSFVAAARFALPPQLEEGRL